MSLQTKMSSFIKVISYKFLKKFDAKFIIEHLIFLYIILFSVLSFFNLTNNYLVMIFLIIIIINSLIIGIFFYFKTIKAKFINVLLTTNIIFSTFFNYTNAVLPISDDTVNLNNFCILYLNNGELSYFPGALSFLCPFLYFSDNFINLNFFSAILSLLILFYLIILLHDILSEIGLVIFILINYSILFYPLLMVRITYNGSAIYYLIFLAFINFLIKFYTSKLTKAQFLFSQTVILISAGFLAPHISMLVSIPILICYLCLFVQKKINFENILYLVVLIILSISLFFIVTKNSIHSYEMTYNLIQNKNFELNESFFKLTKEAIFEFLRIKYPIRNPLDNVLSLFSYLIIFFYIYLIKFVNQIKGSIFLVIFGLYLGVVTITGIGEFAYLKGRSGWYYMLTAAFTISLFLVFLFDKFKFKKANYLIYFLLSVNLLTILIYPPKFFSENEREIYINIKNNLDLKTNNSALIYSNFKHLNFIDKRLIKVDLNSSNILNSNFVVLDKKFDFNILRKSNLISYEKRNENLIFNDSVMNLKSNFLFTSYLLDFFLDNEFIKNKENSEFIILTR